MHFAQHTAGAGRRKIHETFTPNDLFYDETRNVNEIYVGNDSIEHKKLHEFKVSLKFPRVFLNFSVVFCGVIIKMTRET